MFIHQFNRCGILIIVDYFIVIHRCTYVVSVHKHIQVLYIVLNSMTALALTNRRVHMGNKIASQ